MTLAGGPPVTPALITLVDFLLARFAEDEEVARAAHVTTALPPIWDTGLFYGPSAPASEHIARHDPARVLAECEADRLIVAEHGQFWDDGIPQICRVCHDYAAHDAAGWPCRTLRLLALPYADHPDYREEWALAVTSS